MRIVIDPAPTPVLEMVVAVFAASVRDLKIHQWRNYVEQRAYQNRASCPNRGFRTVLELAVALWDSQLLVS
jgi:hypothetical protein